MAETTKRWSPVTPLIDNERIVTDYFPLAEVIGRTAAPMLIGRDNELFPLVEHAGNVMVAVGVDSAQAVLVDIDGWELPVIFL